MSCPGRCAPGEQVWWLDGNLKIGNRVKVATRCSDTGFAPAMALDPASGSLIVGSCEADEAFVLDELGTQRPVAVPYSGGITVVDGFLVVLNDLMTVVDLGTGNVRARVSTGGAAIEAVRYKSSLYLLIEDKVTEVDIATWTIRRTIPLPVDRECMALDADRLLLTTGGGGDVLIVNLSGTVLVKTVPLPSLYCDLMLDAPRRVGYMSYETETEWGVLALDLSDFRELARLSIGDSSVGWIGVNDANDVLYAEVGSELVKINLV